MASPPSTAASPANPGWTWSPSSSGIPISAGSPTSTWPRSTRSRTSRGPSWSSYAPAPESGTVAGVPSPESPGLKTEVGRSDHQVGVAAQGQVGQGGDPVEVAVDGGDELAGGHLTRRQPALGVEQRRRHGRNLAGEEA